MKSLLRALFRMAKLTLITFGLLGSYPFWILTAAPTLRPQRCTRWFNFWARLVADSLDLKITAQGPVPQAGLIVSNHLGYLDILVLSQLTSCVFVSKKEVRFWPFFGQVAALVGTVFVDRGRATALPQVVAQMQDRLRHGLAVVLFPEGTSSNGESVLPFRSSTLAAAQEFGGPVTPAALHYRLEEGSAADLVCYWGDMTFAPHLLKLLSLPRIDATVAFGQPVPRQTDRKQLTQLLQQEVNALQAGLVAQSRSEAKGMLKKS